MAVIELIKSVGLETEQFFTFIGIKKKKMITNSIESSIQNHFYGLSLKKTIFTIPHREKDYVERLNI